MSYTKTKDSSEMQISEINYWLNQILSQRYGKPGTEIYKIYLQVKRAYARVLIDSELQGKRLSRIASKNSIRLRKQEKARK